MYWNLTKLSIGRFPRATRSLLFIQIALLFALCAGISGELIFKMEEETAKSLPIRIQPKMVFGLRPCPGNINFTLEGEVIYTAAAVLVIHNYKTNKQKFLRFPEKVEISYVIISGNRKFLGLAETSNKEK